MGKCYLCGHEGYDIIHNGVRGNPDVNVLKCNKCGLVYLSHFISDTNKFYGDSGMRDYKTPELDKVRIETYEDDHRRFLFTRNKILNKIVCDFGCGAGGYLLEARKIASKVYGIELENAMCSKLQGGGGRMLSFIRCS